MISILAEGINVTQRILVDCPENCACCDARTCYFEDYQCFSDGTPKNPVVEQYELSNWIKAIFYSIFPAIFCILLFVVLFFYFWGLIRRIQMRKKFLRQGIRAGEGQVFNQLWDIFPTRWANKERIPIHIVSISPYPNSPNRNENQPKKEETKESSDEQEKKKNKSTNNTDDSPINEREKEKKPQMLNGQGKALKPESDNLMKVENVENSVDESKLENGVDDSFYPLKLMEKNRQNRQKIQKVVICSGVGNGPHNL